MRRTDAVLVDDDGAGRFGVGDGLTPRQRRHIVERQRIPDGQILQHPVRRARQRRDELLHQGGQPAVVVAGRLDVDPRQQVVTPQRRNLVGHRPVRRDRDDQLRRAADRQLVDQRRGQLVQQMRVVDHQQPAVAQRLPRVAQHGRRLTRARHIDQVAEGGERNRRRRRGNPVDATELRRQPVRRRACQPRLADTRGTDQHRADPVSQRRFDRSEYRFGRRGHPLQRGG